MLYVRPELYQHQHLSSSYTPKFDKDMLMIRPYLNPP